MRLAVVVAAKGEAPEDVERVCSRLPEDAHVYVCRHERSWTWRDLAARERFISRYIELPGPYRGAGHAYRAGFHIVCIQEQYSHVLMYDGDGDMDPACIPSMLDAAARGADLVVASRWARGGGFVGYDRRKLALNWLGNKFWRWALRAPVSDLTYGYKLMTAELAALPYQADDHGIYAETTMLPIALGARCAEVPTVWKGRARGVATLSPAQTAGPYMAAGLRAMKARLQCAST